MVFAVFAVVTIGKGSVGIRITLNCIRCYFVISNAFFCPSFGSITLYLMKMAFNLDVAMAAAVAVAVVVGMVKRV